MTPLWVSCPDEEAGRLEEEAKGIYSGREEALKVLLSSLQAVKPAWVSLHLFPSPALCLQHCSRSSPLKEQAEMTEVDVVPHF